MNIAHAIKTLSWELEKGAWIGLNEIHTTLFGGIKKEANSISLDTRHMTNAQE
jgi:hypothetical protein